MDTVLCYKACYCLLALDDLKLNFLFVIFKLLQVKQKTLVLKKDTNLT